ncbi:hypothetical protein RO31_1815 [Francisella tularensis subsp. tularensis str. SCHU S4 substr. NR-28534]|nr:hypothetical protein RO31_1815 [Francisella tularensis subsp. tularensis str. SCHU S4 substr. NR-28534]
MEIHEKFFCLKPTFISYVLTIFMADVTMCFFESIIDFCYHSYKFVIFVTEPKANWVK